MTSTMAFAGQVVRTGVWLAVLVVMSFAGAGLVVALDHPQTDAGRPELTARSDAIVGPRLAAMTPALAQVADSASELDALGRDLLIQLRAQHVDKVRADIVAGDSAVSIVQLALPALTASRATLLDGTSAGRISATNRKRIAAVDAALTAAADLPAAWGRLADAAVTPTQLLETLSKHDALTVGATDAARAERWDDAITGLAQAVESLKPARQIRDAAAKKGLDVSTLDGWLARLDDYDAALIRLYGILRGTNGEVTPDAQVALDRVNATQAALPKDTSALIIIVSELGLSDVTSGLLQIEADRAPIDRAAGR